MIANLANDLLVNNRFIRCTDFLHLYQDHILYHSFSGKHTLGKSTEIFARPRNLLLDIQLVSSYKIIVQFSIKVSNTQYVCRKTRLAFIFLHESENTICQIHEKMKGKGKSKPLFLTVFSSSSKE